MSKTLAAAFCETNQMRGLPQENVFLQNLYRLPADYGASFQKSASSESKIQICAIASAQGDDTLAAMSLQEVMNIIAGMTAQLQPQQSLDFESFSGQVIAASNNAVCALSLKNQGSPVRVSLTMIIVEDDTLRVISIGNTRALLIRQGRVIALTEDHTMAHRYVQTGTIAPEAERTHPERNVLTQFLGRFEQEGPVAPEKQVYLKLMAGDEICLLGTGISQGISDSERNTALVRASSLESKTSELVTHAMQNGVRGGLTALILRVENTMPAAAFMAVPVMAAAVGAHDFADEEIQPSLIKDPNQRTPSGKNRKARAIITPIAVFLGCFLAGYFGLMLLFNVGTLTMPSSSPATDAEGSEVVLSKVMYITADMVGLYPEANLDATPTVYLSRGDVVTLTEAGDSFSKVTTTDGQTGFVMTSMLSETDPTIGESYPDMDADPTPIPSELPTALTKPTETTAEQTETTKESTTASSETSETTVPSETSVTPAPTEPSVSPTPTEITKETGKPSETPTPSPTTPEITPAA